MVGHVQQAHAVSVTHMRSCLRATAWSSTLTVRHAAGCEWASRKEARDCSMEGEGGCLDGGSEGGGEGAPAPNERACFCAVVKEVEEMGKLIAFSVLQ